MQQLWRDGWITVHLMLCMIFFITLPKKQSGIEYAAIQWRNCWMCLVMRPECIPCFLLSDVWCWCAGVLCVHVAERQDGRTHSKLAKPKFFQHAADQWNHHHLCVLPGFLGRTKGESLSPHDGTTHIAIPRCCSCLGSSSIPHAKFLWWATENILLKFDISISLKYQCENISCT